MQVQISHCAEVAVSEPNTVSITRKSMLIDELFALTDDLHTSVLAYNIVGARLSTSMQIWEALYLNAPLDSVNNVGL